MLRRLGRGQYAAEDELDLHGAHSRAAEQLLRDFLRDALDAGVACVRIVHGKGLRSRATGPVLKALTDRLLRRRDDVIAFASARPALGGTGAVVVLLKR